VTFLTVLLAAASCGSEQPPAKPTNATTVSPTNGGTIQSSDGRFTLVVPAGAVEAPVEISVERIAAAKVAGDFSGSAPVGAVYRLSPAGLSFAKPAEGRWTVHRSELDSDLDPQQYPAILLMLRSADGTIEILSPGVTELDLETQQLTARAPLTHFSEVTGAQGPLSGTVEPGSFDMKVGDEPIFGSIDCKLAPDFHPCPGCESRQLVVQTLDCRVVNSSQAFTAGESGSGNNQHQFAASELTCIKPGSGLWGMDAEAHWSLSPGQDVEHTLTLRAQGRCEQSSGVGGAGAGGTGAGGGAVSGDNCSTDQEGLKALSVLLGEDLCDDTLVTDGINAIGNNPEPHVQLSGVGSRVVSVTADRASQINNALPMGTTSQSVHLGPEGSSGLEAGDYLLVYGQVDATIPLADQTPKRLCHFSFFFDWDNDAADNNSAGHFANTDRRYETRYFQHQGLGWVSSVRQEKAEPFPGHNCAHSLCELGGKLTKACHPCVTTICDHKPQCCEAAGWDSSCKDLVATLCGPAACGPTFPLTLTHTLVLFDMYANIIPIGDLVADKPQFKALVTCEESGKDNVQGSHSKLQGMPQ